MTPSILARAAAALLIGAAANAQQTEAPVDAQLRIAFNIEAQPVRDALQVFGEQTGLQVLFRSEAVSVEGVKAQPVSGELSPDEALRRMLERTGLDYEFVNARTVRVSRADAAAEPDNRSGAGHERSRPSGDRLNGSEPAVSAAGAPNKQSANGDSASTGFSVIAEIVVTAQKKIENLQDVPIPITVLDADTLSSNGKFLLRDYATAVPGFNVTANYGFTQNLSMRGITTGGFSNPTVGITVDDVPYGPSFNNGGGNAMPDFDPGDLARVEVLRGPQGTLYGTNSMGGLLKYVTKDPSFGIFDGRFEMGTSGIENSDSVGYQVRASANVPVSETWAMRVSGFTRRDPGYIDNPTIGREAVNEARAGGARLSTLWRPADTFSLKLSALYQYNEGDGVSDVVAQPGVGDLEQNYIPGAGGFEATIQAYSAIASADLGVVNLTSVTGFNINDYQNSYDRSVQFSSAVLANFGVTGAPIFQFNEIEKFTQEVRLSGPLGDNFEWLAGAFYTHEDTNGSQIVFAADSATGQIVGTQLALDFPRKAEEVAAFANLTYHVTDRLDIQIGGRQSRSEERDGVATQSGPTGSTAALPVNSHGDAFTYLVTPRFKVSPDMMVYARFASGYRPGGPNSRAVVVQGAAPQYEPDKTQNYEIGIKSNFLNGALSLDASVYYIDWKDLQIQLRTVNGFTYQSNGSRAKSEGVEVAVGAKPLAGLTIDAWIAYDNAVLTEDFANSPTFGRAGDRLPNTSRLSGNLSVEQEFQLYRDTTGFVGARLSYVGDRIGPFGTSPARQEFPTYATTDLRAGLEIGSWRANIFVNNVTDKRGLIGGGIGYIPAFAYVYNQPRNYGVNVSKSF